MSQPAERREGKPAMLKDKDFVWEDPLGLEDELTEEERMVRDTAKGFAQDYLMPRIVAAYRDETYDAQMLPEMGKLGLLGPTTPEEYGGAGLGLCQLRADRARTGAGGLRLPLGHVGAVVAGHVSDLCLWDGSAAAEISAQACHAPS